MSMMCPSARATGRGTNGNNTKQPPAGDHETTEDARQGKRNVIRSPVGGGERATAA